MTTEPRGGLREALVRLDGLLADHLRRLRQRGRSPLGDLVRGSVIEDGEAEGIIAELEALHSAAETPASAPPGGRSPLATLERAAERFGLSGLQRDIVLFGLAVEVDARYGRLLAYLNDHAERARPTIGLAAALFGGETTEVLAAFLPESPLIDLGLVVVDGDGPLPGRAFHLHPSFWPRLVGLEGAPWAGDLRIGGPEKLGELTLSEGTLSLARATAEWASARPRRSAGTIVLVRGREGYGRESLASAIMFHLRPHVLVVRAAALEAPELAALVRRDVAWHDAALVVLDRAPPSSAAALDLLTRLDAPVAWVTGPGSPETMFSAVGRPIVELEVEPHTVDTRVHVLEHVIPAERRTADLDLPGVAGRFRFGPGRMGTAARAALARASVVGEGRVSPSDLEHACRSLPEVNLGILAEKLTCPYVREDLVLPRETDREIDLAIAWAKHRSEIFGRWGEGRKMVAGRGLACLFSGPPGTGKTMAAQVLARSMGLDVYRIDLSQVVSKYIGETEKNLERVFVEAEAAGFVLFFDEADALFGKRTEVKDAHDRYANIETGYLLQRIEQHDGVTILATNLKRNMDDAFLRRLQVIAEFPLPGLAERRRIWERHLPPPTMRGRDLDLDLLATRFAVSGADIRNAVVAGVFMAKAEREPLSMRYLVLGLWRELKKGGRVLDAAELGPWASVLTAN